MNACHLTTITYRSYKNFTKEQFRSHQIRLFLHCGWKINFSLTSNWKKLDQFVPMRKIVLRGNDKPHMTSQLKRGIMKGSRLKKQIKVVNLPIKQLIRHRNLVVEEAKKSFLKIQIKKQKMLQTKRKSFGNYANFFSLKKVFIINRNLLLKLREV